jgi:hypothetical protein
MVARHHQRGGHGQPIDKRVRGPKLGPAGPLRDVAGEHYDIGRLLVGHAD